jgi:hypothetical protein
VAVFDLDLALAAVRQVLVVRHNDERDAMLFVQ